jgi:hypothetical protein
MIMEPYAITFEESGLSSGTYWYVTLDATTRSSASRNITFLEPDGTYSFNIGSILGYTNSPSSISVTVNGLNLTENITFTQTPAVRYNVTFLESGLPSGSSWYVSLNGTTENSTSNGITFKEPNGTYPFSVIPIDGYNVSIQHSTITVNGSAVIASIDFTKIRDNGYFVGSITPSDVTIAIFVNGSWQPFKETNGSFNISLVPGTYRVSISSPGHMTYTFNLTVYPSRVTYTTITTLPSESTFSLLEIEVTAVLILVIAALTTAIILRRRR